jgi:small subunit ribosomal protein S21
VIRHVETYPLSSHSVSLTPSTILRAQGVRRPAAEAQGVRQLAAEARALQRAAQAWQVWPAQASAYLFRAGLARPRSPMPIPRAPAEPTTLQREGVFREMKLRGHYEKSSEKRVREKAEAIRRARKLARKKLQREGLLPMKPRVIPGAPGRGGPPRAPRF